MAKDEGKAVQYYKMAAKQGHPRAQCGLGLCYLEGTGVAKDEGKAVQYWKMAAEQGHAEAQAALSELGLSTGIPHVICAEEGHSSLEPTKKKSNDSKKKSKKNKKKNKKRK